MDYPFIEAIYTYATTHDLRIEINFNNTQEDLSIRMQKDNHVKKICFPREEICILGFKNGRLEEILDMMRNDLEKTIEAAAQEKKV